MKFYHGTNPKIAKIIETQGLTSGEITPSKPFAWAWGEGAIVSLDLSTEDLKLYCEYTPYEFTNQTYEDYVCEDIPPEKISKVYLKEPKYIQDWKNKKV